MSTIFAVFEIYDDQDYDTHRELQNIFTSLELARQFVSLHGSLVSDSEYIDRFGCYTKPGRYEIRPYPLENVLPTPIAHNENRKAS